MNSNVVLITGAQGRLGKHLVNGFTQDKATCITTSRNSKDVLSPEGGNVSLDLSNLDSIENAIIKIKEHFSSLNALVLNAAASSSKNLDQIEASEIRHIMDVNVTGNLMLIKGLLDLLKKGSASVIFISSVYGHLSPDPRVYEGLNRGNSLAYGASKAALEAALKYLTCYYAKDNIRFNCVVPGGISNNQEEPFLSRYNARVPMGRMVDPEEVYKAVKFLAGDESQYITGHSLILDGGLSAW